MDTKCGSCCINIDTYAELYTICEGQCGKRFHGTCVGVCESDLRALSKNIIWICDECMILFYRGRDTKAVPSPVETHSPIMDELSTLKQQVAGIVGAIERITRCVETSTRPVPHHSTPVTSRSSMISTDICSTLGNGSFSLFLTNIDCCVTEQEISQMVSDSLRAPEAECSTVTKLVPKWKKCEDLDFVSFKVTLSNKWKQPAMTATTWPKKVRFREFVNRCDDTWKPLAWTQNTV